MGFVYDNWLNDWRQSKYAGVVRNCDYYDATRSVIEDLLGRGARITVAENPDGDFLGFVCFEVKQGRAVIHYRFVKEQYLGHGLEDSLVHSIDALPGWFTFYDYGLAADKNWKHAPEIARRKSL